MCIHCGVMLSSLINKHDPSKVTLPIIVMGDEVAVAGDCGGGGRWPLLAGMEGLVLQAPPQCPPMAIVGGWALGRG